MIGNWEIMVQQVPIWRFPIFFLGKMIFFPKKRLFLGISQIFPSDFFFLSSKKLSSSQCFQQNNFRFFTQKELVNVSRAWRLVVDDPIHVDTSMTREAFLERVYKVFIQLEKLENPHKVCSISLKMIIKCLILFSLNQ